MANVINSAENWFYRWFICGFIDQILDFMRRLFYNSGANILVFPRVFRWNFCWLAIKSFYVSFFTKKFIINFLSGRFESKETDFVGFIPKIQSIFGRTLNNTTQKNKFSQKNTNRIQYFLTFLRYNSNISPLFRRKYWHICIKIFVIIWPTIYMKINFNSTCLNMLKHVKIYYFSQKIVISRGNS